MQLSDSAVYTKFLQQHGPASLAIASIILDTTFIVVAVSLSLGQAAPKITLNEAPIAGAIPHTPVSPQYAPIACLLVLFKASLICSSLTLIVPLFFIATRNDPAAIQACSHPNMGTCDSATIFSAMINGFSPFEENINSSTVLKSFSP